LLGGGSGLEDNIGGEGGNGGGLLMLQAKEIRNFGNIVVNGGDGEAGNCENTYSSGGGGGAGGCIKLHADSIINHGNITAVGGKGGLATFDDQSPLNHCSSDGGNGLILLKSAKFIGLHGIIPDPKIVQIM
jgi:hypothetical protein